MTLDVVLCVSHGDGERFFTTTRFCPRTWLPLLTCLCVASASPRTHEWMRRLLRGYVVRGLISSDNAAPSNVGRSFKRLVCGRRDHSREEGSISDRFLFPRPVRRKAVGPRYPPSEGSSLRLPADTSPLWPGKVVAETFERYRDRFRFGGLGVRAEENFSMVSLLLDDSRISE